MNQPELNGKYILNPVTSVDIVPYEGDVYDITVPAARSFLTGSGIVSNSSKRKGAIAVYLAPWHLDFIDFIKLRNPSGDERRRAYDTNFSSWIPDLFMERKNTNALWTMFSPDDVPLLLTSHGEEFKKHYEQYERDALEGRIALYQQIPALKLWRDMLDSLYRTGFPWVCFSDPSNMRYSNQHVGTVNSSNLCCITGSMRAPTQYGLLTLKELHEREEEDRLILPGITQLNSSTRMMLPKPNAEVICLETTCGLTINLTPDHPMRVGDEWVEAIDLDIGSVIKTQSVEGLFGKSTTYDRERALRPLDHSEYTDNLIDPAIWTATRETTIAYLKDLYYTNSYVDHLPQGTYASKEGQYLTLNIGHFTRKMGSDLQLLWSNLGVHTILQGEQLLNATTITLSIERSSIQRVLTLLHSNVTPVDEIFLKRTSDLQRDIKRDPPGPSIHEATIERKYPLSTKEDTYCVSVDSETHAWTVQGLITKNTEITLHTDAENTAVCNLASVNAEEHVSKEGYIDHGLLKITVSAMVRNLNAAIDNNFNPIPEAAHSNYANRPLGIGIMGLQSAMYVLGIDTESDEAVAFHSDFTEAVSYYAIRESILMAKEYGPYDTYAGSTWSKGKLPMDTYIEFMKYRGRALEVNYTMDWELIRELLNKYGIRNSVLTAIAPTASIANLCAVTPATEPQYQHLYTATTLSGNITVVNEHLSRQLKKYDYWTPEVIQHLKKTKGVLEGLANVPPSISSLFKTVFEIDQTWLIKAAAARQIWLCQSQSVNIFLKGVTGDDLDRIYTLAWYEGLKTTYYLRTLGATDNNQTEATQEQGELLDNLSNDADGCAMCQ